MIEQTFEPGQSVLRTGADLPHLGVFSGRVYEVEDFDRQDVEGLYVRGVPLAWTRLVSGRCPARSDAAPRSPPLARPQTTSSPRRTTTVEFPAGIVQGEMPPLFVIGSDGEAQIVNSRTYRHILIVDRLFGAAELRLGSGDHQQTVRIVRADGRPQS